LSASLAIRNGSEALLLQAIAAGLRAAGPSGSLRMGQSLGDLARSLGLRGRVARDNLRLAFPERSESERDAILAGHYREVGRIVGEYPRMPELARAPRGVALAELEGEEHLEAARAAGRGAVLVCGHYGFFELGGAFLGQLHPVSFVVRPMRNPYVESWIAVLRRKSGIGTIDANRGIRGVYEALRANQWVAMLADQDARRAGVFVPFLGRPASTALGPARIALATGAAVIMGRMLRRPDGRHDLRIEPPLAPPDPRAPDAALRLTETHVAILERWVRERPEPWFWLHRRWKTRPPGEAGHAPL
jgi:Kdo2-lipid IVA lauroyltransferase/acyltransferase